jgi:hypothetical protein
MAMEHWNKRKASAAPFGVASGVQDAQDIAAALLLRRVESMLRQGQPRQAIAHICETTGIDRAQAEAFVAELKAQLFSEQG